MKWQGREQSSNIEDRRNQGGSSGGFGGGGQGGGFGGGSNPFGQGGGFRIPTGRTGGGIGGIVLLIIILAIAMAFGFNPLSLIDGTGGTGSTTSSSSGSYPSSDASDTELTDFVGVVVKETENLWTEVFKQNDMTYVPPKVVLFSGQTESACGEASASTGPFYCPDDKKVYVDLAFYNQLRDQFGAPGDFAQAYVIAHEVGHHVQNLTGILPEFNHKRQSMSEDQANAYSVRIELQADCYAGIWANYEGKEGILDNGDYEEAMNAANQIGDDTLTRGTVASRNFTHGTSAQRMKWFKTGYSSGDVGKCDTLSGSI